VIPPVLASCMQAWRLYVRYTRTRDSRPDPFERTDTKMSQTVRDGGWIQNRRARSYARNPARNIPTEKVELCTIPSPQSRFLIADNEEVHRQPYDSCVDEHTMLPSNRLCPKLMQRTRRTWVADVAIESANDEMLGWKHGSGVQAAERKSSEGFEEDGIPATISTMPIARNG